MKMNRRILAALCVCALFRAAQAAEPALSLSVLSQEQESPREAVKKSLENPVKAGSIEEGTEQVRKLVRLESPDGVRVMSLSGGGAALSATGTAEYAVYANADASEISKRNAYTAAYLKAQGELARYLGEAELEGLTLESGSSEDFTDSALAGTLTNEARSLAEDLTRTVRGTVRSFVVSDLYDREGADGGRVSVTIVTSEKLAQKIRAVTPGLTDAAALTDALDQVRRELEQSVLPPVGGKAVRLPGSDEIALIAFGSELIVDRGSEERSLAAAQRRAGIRADRSLIEMLSGSEALLKYGLSGETKEERKTFETVTETDFFGNRTETKKALDQMRETLLSNMKDSDVRKFITKGVIPPGTETEFYRLGRWCFCVRIYSCSLSQRAADMKDRLGGAAGSPAAAGNPPAMKNDGMKRPAGRGPSGHVQDFSIL